MPEKFESFTPSVEEPEGWDIEEDASSLRQDFAKLAQSEQPLPQPAQEALDEFTDAESTEDKLAALRRIDEAIADYDPVKEEIESQDARALVKRMIMTLEGEGE